MERLDLKNRPLFTRRFRSSKGHEFFRNFYPTPNRTGTLPTYCTLPLFDFNGVGWRIRGEKIGATKFYK